jgi:hypothetical protein
MPVSSGFWPSDIRPKVQTPLAILRARAIELGEITNSVLIGSVSTHTNKEKKQTLHSLDVTVPALRNLRQRLFTVRHATEMVYPVYIHESLCAPEPHEDLLGDNRGFRHRPESSEYEAFTDWGLIELLKRALSSDHVKSVLLSLIAMANQSLEEDDSEDNDSLSGQG